jgi:hypothetical protein
LKKKEAMKMMIGVAGQEEEGEEEEVNPQRW